MISVISPFHKPYEKYVWVAYKCLREQTLQDWQWILVPNLGADVPKAIKKDKRVKTIYFQSIEDEKKFGRNRIGWLKKTACQASDGEIIVEYDIDDILLPQALEKIREAFFEPSIVFVYSNNADFLDGSWESNHYSDYWGWRWREFEFEGHILYEMLSWPPNPQSMRFIFWAPDHVRAWRKEAYLKIGGHDEALFAGDDHDLICRFFIEYGTKGFNHIDECLYLYRKHDLNSCRVWNDDVQKQTEQNYIKHNRKMATKWARDEGLRLVDLGGRFNSWPNYETVDFHEPADIIWDLNESFPFEDSSVGVLKAHHIFEHLKDPIHMMNEAFRVLAPGGWLYIEVPSTDGRGAFQDPTHVSFWNENSFLYYIDKNFARFIKPKMRCRFQKSRIITYYPNEWFEKNKVPVVQADLICLKPPYDERPAGEILI